VRGFSSRAPHSHSKNENDVIEDAHQTARKKHHVNNNSACDHTCTDIQQTGDVTKVAMIV
jgi:hypothetical protein